MTGQTLRRLACGLLCLLLAAPALTRADSIVTINRGGAAQATEAPAGEAEQPVEETKAAEPEEAL